MQRVSKAAIPASRAKLPNENKAARGKPIHKLAVCRGNGKTDAVKTEFPQSPICEICEKEAADRFINFPIRQYLVAEQDDAAESPNPDDAEQSPEEEGEEINPAIEKMQGWRFCGECMFDSGHYEIMIDDFFHSPASTVDWIAHLNEKMWMDWKDFAEMMERFRANTKSFNQP